MASLSLRFSLVDSVDSDHARLRLSVNGLSEAEGPGMEIDIDMAPGTLGALAALLARVERPADATATAESQLLSPAASVAASIAATPSLLAPSHTEAGDIESEVRAPQDGVVRKPGDPLSIFEFAPPAPPVIAGPFDEVGFDAWGVSPSFAPMQAAEAAPAEEAPATAPARSWQPATRLRVLWPAWQLPTPRLSAGVVALACAAVPLLAIQTGHRLQDATLPTPQTAVTRSLRWVTPFALVSQVRPATTQRTPAVASKAILQTTRRDTARGRRAPVAAPGRPPAAVAAPPAKGTKGKTPPATTAPRPAAAGRGRRPADVRSTRPTVPQAASPKFVGELLVESEPSGAQVFVNLKPVGVAPLLLPKVRAGSYAVQVGMDGYALWSRAVQVVTDRRTQVRATMGRVQ